MSLIANPQEESDEAPEEFSFSVGKEEHEKSIKIQNKEISKTKQRLKDARRLNHERNILQKEEKRKRLEELESKRLPDEMLEALKDMEEQQTLKGELPAKPRKKLRGKKAPKHLTEAEEKRSSESRTRTEKKTKRKKEEEESGLDVIVQIRSLDEEMKKAKSIGDAAKTFRKDKLYGRQAASRMPSKQLRMMHLRRRIGLKVQMSSY